MKETHPDLVWPRLLRRPSTRANLVYLDLNHWISLAQASTGHPTGGPYVNTLEACRGAKASGSAIFVLSGTHYFEMLKIKDPTQRVSVANVMEELTDFATLLGRSSVMEFELSEMLDRISSVPSALPTVPLVGRGVLHTLGLESNLQIFGPSGDVTAEFRDRKGAEAFDAGVARCRLDFERAVLRGSDSGSLRRPSAEESNLDRVSRIAEQRAAEERAQTARLDGEDRWRRGRLRDVVAARELIIEFQDILPRALAERGLRGLSEVVADKQAARLFVRSMPSTEVSIELKTAWHRNRDKPWEANDIHDIDAMALAVPYCDIVVTEKACHHALITAQLGDHMHTALLRNLNDLPPLFCNWHPTRPTGLSSLSKPIQ